MNSIMLISPYFGTKFPDTFSVLIDSLKENPTIQFLIPTDIDFSEFDGIPNVTFVHETLENLNKKIDVILGYHGILNNAYKLCDFRPMFGVLFSKYISSREWWGYFDPDIIFGNIRSFLTPKVLNSYDRIFTQGHLTLFRNTPEINNLWQHDFHVPGVPRFRTVATHSAFFAFDEWGWGKRRGRGLSYALDRSRLIRQFDDKQLIADLYPNIFEFKTTSGLSIRYFTYFHGELQGLDSLGMEHNFLYVHFQKRSIALPQIFTGQQPNYLFPNRIDTVLAPEHVSDDRETWIQNYRLRRMRQLKSNLSFSYLFRRLLFLFSE